jgi:hypothetical protein
MSLIDNIPFVAVAILQGSWRAIVGETEVLWGAPLGASERDADRRQS